MLMTLIHTILTLGVLSLIFKDEINVILAENGGTTILAFILGTIFTNGIVESIIAMLVTPTVYFPLKQLLNKKRIIEIK